MKIQFLGTAAAEGYPSPFCRCANCEEARTIGGRAIRKRASIVIDDVFLIDFGPDLVTAAQHHGLVLADIAWAAQTHTHDDHYYPDNFIYRTSMCGVSGVPRLQYALSPYAAKVFKAFASAYAREGDDFGGNRFPSFNLDLVIHQAWETVTLGPYEVLAIPAVHAPGLSARILGIRTPGGPSFLYGTDTAPLPEGSWQRVAEAGWTFDLLIMDHTHGSEANSSAHHSSTSMLAEIEDMAEAGVADEGVRAIAHHFAHHSNPMPEPFAAFAREAGYEVAWDGLVVDV